MEYFVDVQLITGFDIHEDEQLAYNWGEKYDAHIGVAPDLVMFELHVV